MKYSLLGLLLFTSVSVYGRDCTKIEDGDFYTDKDWYLTNTIVGEPDGRYPELGGTGPFENIQQLIDTLLPGECGYVREGETPYFYDQKKRGEALAGHTFLRGGDSEEARIIVSGYPGERPIIDLERKTNQDGFSIAGFLVADGNYITIRNFEIRNAYGMGIMMHHSNTNRFITVENCHIHHIYGVDNVAAIRLDWCDNCLIRNNIIHDTYKLERGADSETALPVLKHSGIHGYRPSNSIIEHNLIYNVKKGVYQKEPHPEALDSNVVRNNIFYNIEEAAYVLTNMGANLTPAYNPVFAYNLVYNSVGGVISDHYEAVGSSNGLKVFNNTFVQTQFAISMGNMQQAEIYNNIFYGSGVNGPISVKRPGTSPRSNSIKELNYNVYFSTPAIALFDQYLDSEEKFKTLAALQQENSSNVHTVQLLNPIEPNGLTSDPQFISQDDNNYGLVESSPAILNGKDNKTIGAFGNGEQIGPNSEMLKKKIMKMNAVCIRKDEEDCT